MNIRAQELVDKALFDRDLKWYCDCDCCKFYSDGNIEDYCYHELAQAHERGLLDIHTALDTYLGRNPRATTENGFKVIRKICYQDDTIIEIVDQKWPIETPRDMIRAHVRSCSHRSYSHVKIFENERLISQQAI